MCVVDSILKIKKNTFNNLKYEREKKVHNILEKTFYAEFRFNSYINKNLWNDT